MNGIIDGDIINRISATSSHFKWELLLYCLHCPTLNKVFLLLLLQNINRANETWGQCGKVVFSIVIYGLIVLYKKWNNVCTVMMNCLYIRSSDISVFISHFVTELGK